MPTSNSNVPLVATRARAAGVRERDVRRAGRRSLAALLWTLAAVVTLAVPAQVGTDLAPGTPAAAQVATATAGIPLEAQGAVSRVIGAREQAYWVRSTPQGASASAPGLSAHFARNGVTFRAGPHEEILGLDALGRDGVTADLPAVTPHAARNRVVYARGSVQEWYANGPLGLEQGFQIAHRPLAGAGPLELAVAAGGDLRPVLDRDRLGLSFRARGGSVVLRYRGVSASDATGRALPVHLALRGDHIQIAVDDSAARYPVSVDPFVQSAMLRAHDGVGGEGVGNTLAISRDGSTIVVAGPNSGPGTVYVFEKPSTGWADASDSGTITLPAHGNQSNVLADVDVSPNGDTIVAAAIGSYLYTRPAGGWTGQYLTTPTATLAASAGSVAISGDTVAVGDRGASVDGHFSQGAVHVFVKPPAGWQAASETALLTASDGAGSEYLGMAVAVSGDTIVASAGHGPGGTVYVFVRPGGGWASGTQTAELSASGVIVPFGGLLSPNSLAVSGDAVVAGGPFANVGPNTHQGTVYVFGRPGGGWQSTTIESAKLTTSDPAASQELGRAVAFDGSTIVAGAELSATSDHGAAYVYSRPAGGWADATETQKLSATDSGAGDNFGIAVGVGQSAIVVGDEFGSAVTSGDDVGKAYVFSGPPVPVVAPPASGSSVPPAEQLAAGALACTSAKVVLINVLQRSGKVLLTGAARAALAGQMVKIRYMGTGAVVASGTVGAGGLFSFKVPLPPAKVRATNQARYQAVLGSNVSLALKLERRADMLQAKLAGGRVRLVGRVTGAFKAGAPVAISLRATCGAFKTVGKTKLTKAGTFTASVPALAGLAGQIAVYRASTTVLLNRRPQTTYTLPIPPTT